jgi:hypothetical protein
VIAKSKLFPWSGAFLLLLLLEAEFFFAGLFPFIGWFLVSITIFIFSKRSFQERILLSLVGFLGLLSVSWSQVFFSQVIVACFLFLWWVFSAENRSHSLRETALFLFLFFLFTNFFIFRSTIPGSYGLLILAALVILSFVIQLHLSFSVQHTINFRLAAMILTVLTVEALAVFRFLPQGYFTLGLITLIFYVLIYRLTPRIISFTLEKKRIFWEAGFALLAILLLFLSAGIRPR